MRYVSKTHSRAAAFIVCAAASLFAFDRPAFADNPDEVVDSDDDSDDAVPDTTVDGGYADTDPSAVTAFRADLAPYGAWTEDSRYGTVWVPNSTVVGADFAPYQSAGHWDLVDDGDWMWQSDYDWGYIPFHYGRWVWTDFGWAWIPGRAYANAWVSWRVGYDGYIGWAPMPPAYYWWNGGVVILGAPPFAAYGFCNSRDVFSHDLHHHMIREKAEVQRAAAATHPYAPPGRNYTPASPTLADAHVGSKNAPMHAKPDPRSTKLAKPPGGARSLPATSVGRSEHGGAPMAASAGQHAGVERPSRGETSQAAQRSFDRSGPRTSGERASGERPSSERMTEERSFQAPTRRLDTSRTLSGEPIGHASRTISTEPRSFHTDVRSLDEVHVVRRPSISEPQARPQPSFERGQAFDRPRPSPSFESRPSPSFESRPSPSFESRPSPSFSQPHYSPSFSHSAPSAPTPHRSSAPAPSFRGGGGGGHFGGGGHHR